MKFTVNGYEYEAKTSTFPGGEEYVSLPTVLPIEGMAIVIQADIRSSKEVMQLLQQLRDGGLIAITGQSDTPNVEFKK